MGRPVIALGFAGALGTHSFRKLISSSVILSSSSSPPPELCVLAILLGLGGKLPVKGDAARLLAIFLLC